MSARRFPSKVDRWLAVTLFIALGVQFCGLLIAISSAPGPATTAIVLLTTAIVYPLLLSILLRTYYEVDPATLLVVSGPFCWRIPRASIHGVEPTRSLQSSPALSRDRLKIRYGERRWIMVSPADQPGFLKALDLSPTGHKGELT